MTNLAKTSFLLGLAALLLLTQVAWSQSPGTAGDPLVSKSFVDHFLKFRSMLLPADASIKPEGGALLVVRSGQLRLEAPKGKTLIDLTAGREISGGNDLPHNHLIIVPDSAAYVLKARTATMLLASCLIEEKAP
ncbi:MAG: hypothetical protein CVV41_03435 [Candidatus Riflebacteria bacterium HGW-Riflebacteria-1]|jgi:hypothetical protein|nr:MAG: hypothetical protein CVV41_03435 [Candidatus Riflebacteria bacterium HGW-Riflebacteria-1]